MNEPLWAPLAKLILLTLALAGYLATENYSVTALLLTSAIVTAYFLNEALSGKTIMPYTPAPFLILAYATSPDSGGMWILLAWSITVWTGALPMTRTKTMTFLLIQFSLHLAAQFIEWNAAGLVLFLAVLFFTFYGKRALDEYRKLQQEHDQVTHDYRRLKRLAFESDATARAEERTRIARDLHDSVGHKLTALMMQLEMISIRQDHDELAPVRQLVRDSLEETREAVKTLRVGEREGIASVLQLIRKLESESNVSVRLVTGQGALSVHLSNDVNTVIYRVIQEALTNAMRHANAREITIELGRTAADELRFSIKNRINEKKRLSNGTGIRSMRERVTEAGGTFLAHQTHDEFIVEGSVPVKGWGT